MASNTLTAWDITALRFVTTGLILLPPFWRRGLGTLRWPTALFLACGAGAPYVLFTAGGLAFAPGGHMGVIAPSCMLLFSTLGSRLILDDRLPLGRIDGVLTIFAGIVVLGWDGLANHGERTWLGDAMFLLGGMFSASLRCGAPSKGQRRPTRRSSSRCCRCCSMCLPTRLRRFAVRGGAVERNSDPEPCSRGSCPRSSRCFSIRERWRCSAPRAARC